MAEIADEWMDLEEIDLDDGVAFLGEPAQVPQAEGAAVQRDSGRPFDSGTGPLTGQVQ